MFFKAATKNKKSKQKRAKQKARHGNKKHILRILSVSAVSSLVSSTKEFWPKERSDKKHTTTRTDLDEFSVPSKAF